MATSAVQTAGVSAATSGLRRQTALATLSIQALTGASLDRLMTRALETAVMLTGGAEASLWQLSPSAGRLERRQAVGGVSPGRGLACSAGETTAFGRCLITGQPVLVGDWRRDVRFERPPHPEGTGMRSTAVVPVPGGAWTGVLAVHAGGPDAFSADTTVMLSEVAGVLGAGIRRSALERLLRARSDQHAALAELGRLALSDTPLGQVLQRATGLLADAMGADLVTVCIRDAEGALQVDAAHPTAVPAEHTLRSSLTVGIGPECRHGTLSLHSRRADAYSWSDRQLVEACASLLAAAVERCPAAGLELARRRAVSAMLQADAEERARIAGELHDDTVQEMAAILFTLDRVVKAARRGDAAAVLATAVQARTTLATATERARRLLFELRPPMLEAGGLSAALLSAGESPGAVVTVRGHIGRHPQAVETFAYRAMSDLIAEARGHAGVTRVTVELNQVDGHLEGIVSRDGPGHAAGPLPPALAAVAERLMLAGGRLEVGLDAPGVTSARLRMPLSALRQ